MAKNSQRLQGVVLGTVVGTLIHALFGHCVWWGYLATGSLLFLWVSVMLFAYYHSPVYGYTALLLCVFGARVFVTDCADEGFDPAGTFYLMADAAVAILTITAVDLAFAPGRASDMACEAYLDSWQHIRTAVRSVLDPEARSANGWKRIHLAVTTQRRQRAILKSVQAAEHLGKEAAEEPRFWRTPWRAQLFADAIQVGYHIHAILSGMERRMIVAPKVATTSEVLRLPSFQRIRAVLLGKIDQIKELLEIFGHEVSEPMEELQDPRLRKEYLDEEREARAHFIQEVNELVWEEKAVHCLMDADLASHVSLLLADIDLMMQEMQKLHFAIFQSC